MLYVKPAQQNLPGILLRQSVINIHLDLYQSKLTGDVNMKKLQKKYINKDGK